MKYFKINKKFALYFSSHKDVLVHDSTNEILNSCFCQKSEIQFFLKFRNTFKLAQNPLSFLVWFSNCLTFPLTCVQRLRVLWHLMLCVYNLSSDFTGMSLAALLKLPTLIKYYINTQIWYIRPHCKKCSKGFKKYYYFWSFSHSVTLIK